MYLFQGLVVCKPTDLFWFPFLNSLACQIHCEKNTGLVFSVCEGCDCNVVLTVMLCWLCSSSCNCGSSRECFVVVPVELLVSVLLLLLTKNFFFYINRYSLNLVFWVSPSYNLFSLIPLLFFCLVLLHFLSSFVCYWPIHLPFISLNLCLFER